MSDFRNIELPPHLKKYFSRVYEGVDETDAIIATENKLFELLAQQLGGLSSNQYVTTATEWGIKKYEDMLGIIVDPTTETLEFRRERVLNRLTMNPPYTAIFLRQKLDEILGVNGYNLYIAYKDTIFNGDEDVTPAHTMIVESAADNFQWYEELAITIGKIKPANMVYITRPLLRREVLAAERVGYSEMTWNYKLNGGWLLGDEKPFVSMSDKGVVKVESNKSLKEKLFEVLSVAAKDAVTKIVVNDTYEITDFTATSTTNGDTNGVMTLMYSVPATSGLGVINKIAVHGVDGKLSESNIYVPLVQDVEMKHTMTIKEGV